MSFGRPYILKISGCIHDGWLAIVSENKINKDFLYYVLLSSNWYFSKKAVGTTVKNLNSERVANLPVPLPPLETQRRIVNRIESLFSKIDQNRAIVDMVLAEIGRIKKSVLSKIFKGEL